jgi:hypothetical protein
MEPLNGQMKQKSEVQSPRWETLNGSDIYRDVTEGTNIFGILPDKS